MMKTLLFSISLLFINISNKQVVYNLNNPAIFMGSTFGAFFQVMHKTGKYEDMLIYTSKVTKNEFSTAQILNFYQNMQFSYPLKLKTITKQTDYQIMHYKTTINATEKTLQFKVVVENDTCRAYFEKLSAKKPFIGM